MADDLLRERAKRVEEITDEKWETVNSFNREKVEEFLYEMVHLSKHTLRQYKSGLRIFYVWVEEALKGKNIYEIKKKDFMRFQNFLVRRGLSSNAIKFKRSAVSSLNKYLINFYEDEEEFATFRNFVEGVPVPAPNKVYNKVQLTKDEVQNVMDTLEQDGQYQILAAFSMLYQTGCRRAELVQIKKDSLDSDSLTDKEGNSLPLYKTNSIRAKGKGEQGEVKSLVFGEDAKRHAKLWLEHRGEDDCPYLFVSKVKGEYQQIHNSALNYWFKEIISDIVGRRVNPHLIRASRSSHVIADTQDIKKAQRLLGHKDSSTTDKFYNLNEDDDDMSDIF